MSREFFEPNFCHPHAIFSFLSHSLYQRVVQGEIESVGKQVREKEKNCSKLIKEKKMLDHDRSLPLLLK